MTSETVRGGAASGRPLRGSLFLGPRPGRRLGHGDFQDGGIRACALDQAGRPSPVRAAAPTVLVPPPARLTPYGVSRWQAMPGQHGFPPSLRGRPTRGHTAPTARHGAPSVNFPQYGSRPAPDRPPRLLSIDDCAGTRHPQMPFPDRESSRSEPDPSQKDDTGRVTGFYRQWIQPPNCAIAGARPAFLYRGVFGIYAPHSVRIHPRRRRRGRQ